MRIVAGRWRGRVLTAPAGDATRPTADRVRQAVFDMLMHAPWGGREVVEGAVVLDVFAGTGAMGLEALSRGAAHVTFIENAPAALAALRANIRALKAEAVTTVLAVDATRVLAVARTGSGVAPGGANLRDAAPQTPSSPALCRGPVAVRGRDNPKAGTAIGPRHKAGDDGGGRTGSGAAPGGANLRDAAPQTPSSPALCRGPIAVRGRDNPKAGTAIGPRHKAGDDGVGGVVPIDPTRAVPVTSARTSGRPSNAPAATLVFLDPPYGQDLIPRALDHLRSTGWIAPEALIVAETGRNEALPHAAPLAERIHGAARISVWREPALNSAGRTAR